MTSTKILNSVRIAALLGCASAHAADRTMLIAVEDGKQVASFKVGDFSCVLRESQLRCTR